MNKLRGRLFFSALFLILAISSIALISAQIYPSSNIGQGLASGITNVVEIVKLVFGTFFGFILGDSELLFEKILIFLIIFSIVFLSVSRVPALNGNQGVRWVVIIGVALLSTRFLTEIETIQSIMLPYGVLGVSLSSILPLIIGFYFIKDMDNEVLRRGFWFLFIVVFIGLWRSRSTMSAEAQQFSWIYVLAAAGALLFFLFDGTIRDILIRQEMKRLGKNTRMEYQADAETKLNELETKQAGENPYPDWLYQRKRSRLLGVINSLSKR